MANRSSYQRKKIQRSVLYPTVPLSECYDFVQHIYSLSEISVPYTDILDELGIKNPDSKFFVNRISTAKQYQFITVERNGEKIVRLTELAKQILHTQEGGSDRRQLFIKAFQNPPLYRKLIIRFKNRILPPKSQLSNILMNDFAISPAAKNLATTCFLESASYLECIDHDILSLEPIEPSSHSTKTNIPHLMPEQKDDRVFNFNICGGRKKARFYIPIEAAEEDLEYLKRCVPDFLEYLKANINHE